MNSAAAHGFTNTDVLPAEGQTIIVEKYEGAEVVHIYGQVSEVIPDEGRICLEHPEGVDRFVWFPAANAGWREVVDPEERLALFGIAPTMGASA